MQKPRIPIARRKRWVSAISSCFTSSRESASAGSQLPQRPAPVLSSCGLAHGWLFTRRLPSVFSNFPRAIQMRAGIYVWSKRAFGDFPGFITAWTYWTCNLPYFPAVLYFAASNALYMRPHAWGHLSSNTTYYIVFSVLALTVATLLNILGLDVGTWLHNSGALPCGFRSRSFLPWALSHGTASDRPHPSQCTR